MDSQVHKCWDGDKNFVLSFVYQTFSKIQSHNEYGLKSQTQV